MPPPWHVSLKCSLVFLYVSVCLSDSLSALQKLNEQLKVLEHADEFPDNASTEGGRLRKQLLQVCTTHLPLWPPLVAELLS